ncbi:MAG: radical SAM protein [Halococcoides sp.]
MHSEGCRRCARGAVLTLFVTGRCPNRGCFYCPLGAERRTAEHAFANERPVESVADVLAAAERMDALGTAVTGGEPLAVLDRTCEYVDALVTERGPDHYVHLYTGETGDREAFERLAAAGLDEIRFHPPIEVWGTLRGGPWERALEDARAAGLRPGFEIPGIEYDPEFVALCTDGPAAFVNVNEFEVSAGNAAAMRAQGYSVADEGNRVEGSGEVLDRYREHDAVFVCTSQFKDAAQHRNRMKRTAERVSRPFEEITDDGTIVVGRTEADPARLEELGVPEEYYAIEDGHVAIAWWLLEEMVEDGDLPAGAVVEVHPTVERPVLSRTPL